MVEFERFVLDNGLKVIVHEDHSAPIAVVNLLYQVGARDENEEKTGFAHLFEHLMFGGSKHIPSYDEPLQKVGGDNNAFTSNDITNYYITLPSANIETAFWLESDRMLSLSFDPEVLEVQRSVVIEEFKQRYLNQPYGDAWLKLRPLAYQKHPYKWNTIGKEIAHIEEATMEDVKDFFFNWYVPNNAILVVGGDVTVDQVKALAEKWFGPIPSREIETRALPKEPRQEEYRSLDVEEDVPLDSLYMTFHMCGRNDEAYHATDLLSDILGRGKSSRLYKRLVDEDRVFSSISAYVTGSIDPGLLTIHGKVNSEFNLAQAEGAVWKVLDDFMDERITAEELEKVKNKAESTQVFSEMELLNRAMNLAYAEMLGDADLANQEAAKIRAVSVEDIRAVAKEVIRKTNASVLRYHAKQK
ncbi:M16 family metallopeptidase [Roseivirga pacifica]|uniref:M16 family metallopeptidase n=1 Tax=Roseivirga pacifica TaxID=1267423 RepID=UPI00209613C2|nr:pitrilysin family protein [Roseivirga pacifica]MCO6359918.1 insulinase family protein [Roseivirga pacifica]MCO6367288.1 insulinase family protein [Roseivirga pacifica]MCO6370180.1 insulinase family protein [Roseivirga pacifica]MCO6374945.1 insulinase family protein [Roseivirga pacifica]MCO6380203.1 insulinase family protein [Roseivirga pacifica]